MNRTNLAFAPVSDLSILLEESLTAPQWCELLGIKEQPFRRRAGTPGSGVVTINGRLVSRQVFTFGQLPQAYRDKLDAIRVKQAAPSFTALLQISKVETRNWEPKKSFSEYFPSQRERAELWRDTLAVFFRALGIGAAKGEANRLARVEYERLSGSTITEKQISRWVKKIEERGGEFAPIEAYCDDKACPHIGARKAVPEDFLRAVRAKALEPTVGTMTAAVRFFELKWMNNEPVPGYGRCPARGTPFPITAAQLDKRNLMPGKGVRVLSGEGKFRAKVEGFLPALPLASAELRLRERIVFDDKRLDITVLSERGLPITPVLYLAMDESTRQILGYLLREEGGVRQTDVEGLTAFVLGVAGFAGRTAGYATTLKFERGTVAISPAREKLLTALFPGEIIISRTSMLGGANAPGDFKQEASGNFFGKGKIESFMKTLDEYSRHIVGQRGNVHRNTPLMLGDLLLTPEKLTSKNYKPKGTMVEEAVLCAQTARAVHFINTGELPDAFTAAQATEIKGPLLYITELHAAVQAVIAYYNAQRGHDREGFLELPMVGHNGGLVHVRESSNDKATRLHRELSACGKSLQRIGAADTALLLHKVKQVTVTANGVDTSIGGTKRRYWHQDSLAVHEAQQQQLGEKTFLALYNPEDPRELYLLRNCVSHVPASAEELPPGEEPHFLESLPLYLAPEMHHEDAMLERARRVQTQADRAMFEVVRDTAPTVAAHTERREHNLQQTRELGESVRAAVNVLHDPAPAVEREASALGEEMATGSRAEERRNAPAATEAERNAATAALYDRES